MRGLGRAAEASPAPGAVMGQEMLKRLNPPSTGVMLAKRRWGTY